MDLGSFSFHSNILANGFYSQGHFMDQNICWSLVHCFYTLGNNRKEREESKNVPLSQLPLRNPHTFLKHFLLHLIDQNWGTWPILAAKEDEKWRFWARLTVSWIHLGFVTRKKGGFVIGGKPAVSGPGNHQCLWAVSTRTWGIMSPGRKTKESEERGDLEVKKEPGSDVKAKTSAARVSAPLAARTPPCLLTFLGVKRWRQPSVTKGE